MRRSDPSCRLLDHLVIPAAGLGTRMKAVRGDRPKEMLDVGGRPAIDYAIDEGMGAGISNIIVVISTRKEAIRRHLERTFDNASPPPTVNLRFAYQEEPAGEAEAIAMAEDFAGGKPLAIIYPDNIYLPSPGALRGLKAVFEEYGRDLSALTAVGEVSARGFGNSGRVDLSPMGDRLYRIRHFHPKGPGSFRLRRHGELRTCGMWIAASHFFNTLRRSREKAGPGEFTDGPVKELIAKEREMMAFHLPGFFFDIGHPEGLRLCRAFLARAHGTVTAAQAGENEA